MATHIFSVPVFLHANFRGWNESSDTEDVRLLVQFAREELSGHEDSELSCNRNSKRSQTSVQTREYQFPRRVWFTELLKSKPRSHCESDQCRPGVSWARWESWDHSWALRMHCVRVSSLASTVLIVVCHCPGVSPVTNCDNSSSWGESSF